jgi:hypothetical protein
MEDKSLEYSEIDRWNEDEDTIALLMDGFGTFKTILTKNGHQREIKDCDALGRRIHALKNPCVDCNQPQDEHDIGGSGHRYRRSSQGR